MSKKFRGKFLALLSEAKLNDSGSQEYLADLFDIKRIISTLYQKDWYVYCKRPFKTTSSVLEYLGRYTHRVAISNYRIMSFENGIVTFSYRDYSDKNSQKLMSLPVMEFMRRFLLHVLPPGFTKIRHYGILGSAVKAQKLAICDKQMRFARTVFEPLTTVELIQKLTGIDITVCPVCGLLLSRAAPTLKTA